VALLRVPVISSVGHHTDRTLLDDVAAVSCSTPTHAAEAAVPVHCGEAHAALRATAARLERQGRRATVDRARQLARLSRAPAQHVDRHRVRLHQELRELRAAARRGLAERERATGARAAALRRQGAAAELARRRRQLDALAVAIAAHDPQRTLERGYALVEGRAGEPVTSAAAASGHEELTLRLHDGRLTVRPDPSGRRVP
jgi:exodeoxyribonuclease VII large subunit